MVFEELPQLGTAAVHLVAADEIEADPVGVRVRADADCQLPFGAEPQVQGQAGDQRRYRVADVLARYPLPGADQRVPGALPHVRQVHGVNAVRDPARASQVLPLDTGRASTVLLLPGLIQRPGRHPARPADPPGGIISPATANRRTMLIAATSSQLA